MPNLSYLLGASVGASVLATGLLLNRLDHATLGGIAILTGFVALLAIGFVFALRELGALDAPPEPPGVLESGPDILSVDLTDRDDR